MRRFGLAAFMAAMYLGKTLAWAAMTSKLWARATACASVKFQCVPMYTGANLPRIDAGAGGDDETRGPAAVPFEAALPTPPASGTWRADGTAAQPLTATPRMASAKRRRGPLRTCLTGAVVRTVVPPAGFGWMLQLGLHLS